MCNPLAIIAAGATIASTAMSGMAAKNQVTAQNQLQQQAMERSRTMRQQEQARQDAFRNRNAAELDKTIDRYDPATQKKQLEDIQGERVQNAQGFADEISSLSPDAVATPGGNRTNEVVNDDLAKRLSQAASETRKRIAAYAKLGGYEQNFAKNALANEAGNREMNLVNNMRQGSLATSGAGIGLVNQNVGTADKNNSIVPAVVGGLGKLLSTVPTGGY